MVQIMEEKFEDFKNPTFNAMKWVDPKYWESQGNKYVVDDIKVLAAHFEGPLKLAAFSLDKVLNEWKNFKVYART